MNNEYKIFLCYRDSAALFAKNFKLYADEITNDINEDRNFGAIWYSDFEPNGNYLDDKMLKDIIFEVKYFIIFITKNFTVGFFDKHGKINENCATAKEIYLAELARRKNGLKFIFINLNGCNFSKNDLKNLENLFLLKGILEKDTMNFYQNFNKNVHNLRQNIDKVFYERILSGIEEHNKKFKMIEFGSYPQTKIDDPILISKLNQLISNKPSYGDLNGWDSFEYFYNGKTSDYFLYKDVTSNNKKYRAIISLKLRPFLTTFEKSYLNKINMEINRIYWFKYEKILWKVIKEDKDVQFLLSDKVLDSQPINNTVNDYNDIPSNDYSNSFIRCWLNKKFYNWAFSDKEQKIIIDNTQSIDNTNISKIKDNVFLIDKKDVEKYLGYISNRFFKPTDYAMYQGVYGIDASDWFLRTKYENSDTDMYYVNGESGKIKEDLVIYTNGGIVPAILIKRK